MSPCNKVDAIGWTNNDLALAWLEHSDSHMKSTELYTLPVSDDHESHCSVVFRISARRRIYHSLYVSALIPPAATT
jgi:hypothetical protein